MTNANQTTALIASLLQNLASHRAELESAFEQAELSGESLDSFILDLTAIANTNAENKTAITGGEQ